MRLHYQMYTPEDYEYDKNKIIKLSENNINPYSVLHPPGGFLVFLKITHYLIIYGLSAVK